jgi:proteic killer suppression protein
MLLQFKHKGLAELERTGSSKSVSPTLQKRILRAFNALAAANNLRELGKLGNFRIHRRQDIGDDCWSIDIGGPERIIFRYRDGEAFDIDF